jgi:hypothetical protein
MAVGDPLDVPPRRDPLGEHRRTFGVGVGRRRPRRLRRRRRPLEPADQIPNQAFLGRLLLDKSSHRVISQSHRCLPVPIDRGPPG